MKQKGTLRASVLLSLLLVSLTPAVKASAAVPALSAVADRAVVEAGGYVTVNITLSNNPPLSTLGMALGYDSGVLKYDSTSWSGRLIPAARSVFPLSAQTCFRPAAQWLPYGFRQWRTRIPYRLRSHCGK